MLTTKILGATRTRTCTLAAMAALTAFTVASPAGAHQGHASCADNAHQNVVSMAQAGLAGELAPPLAQSGELPGLIASNHDTYCDPQP